MSALANESLTSSLTPSASASSINTSSSCADFDLFFPSPTLFALVA